MSPLKEKHRSKSDKKSKSSTHGEKKRKRDVLEDGTVQKTKSKKHKSDKHANVSSSAVASLPIKEKEDSISPFHLQTSSLYLPLAPISQKYPLEGLCAEHLSPLLLTYYPPFNGVILSYTNPRLSEHAFGSTPLTLPTPATNPSSAQDSSSGHHQQQQPPKQPENPNPLLLKNIDEYAVSWTWLTADFLLFKPERGIVLEGYVNLQNEGHLGLVCWNLFNASIERSRLPSSWTWNDVSTLQSSTEKGTNEGYAEDGQGTWVDANGEKVEGIIRFRVKEIESSHDRERGFLSIEGTMLSEREESDLVVSEKEGNGKVEKGRRLGGDRALGATSLGVVVEESAEQDGFDGKKRNRSRY